MASRIEDYALIGDGQTAALVARDGSIDWMCWPHFDSDACFAALLGTPENGRWLLAPADPALSVRRAYRDGTLVLDTEFTASGGVVRLTDFMPLRDGHATVVRIVTGLSGQVDMTSDLALRFDYGSIAPWVSRNGAEVTAVVGPTRAVLRADVMLDEASSDRVAARFTVRAGETVRFTLRCGPGHEPAAKAIDADAALRATEAYWREWSGRFDKPTDWPDAVRRSLITLKALTHHQTGGLVAAPTAGLPEKLPGKMNWDYRFCWLRDATFTLSALLNAGYHAEATAWHDWLLRAVAGDPAQMHIMYRLDGGRMLDEREIPWLAGYEGSGPVRIGNAAAGQLQLDVYGEVIDSLSLAAKAGIPRQEYGLDVERRLVEHVESVWQQPDQGLWESRGAPEHYVYSKAMAWVAVDRYLRAPRGQGPDDDAARSHLTTLRDEMHREICARGYDEKRRAFTASYGSRHLDASVLLLPVIGFLPATDPRMRATVATLREELTEDGLVRRHRAPWLGREEGSFIACSCWLADCLHLQGDETAARDTLERVLDLRNDVGLLSEEYHVPKQRQLGNFPQALSHLAVVNTALSLCGPTLTRGAG